MKYESGIIHTAANHPTLPPCSFTQVARKLQRRGGAGARLAPLSDEDVAAIVALLKSPAQPQPRLLPDLRQRGDEPRAPPPPPEDARRSVERGDGATYLFGRQAREPNDPPPRPPMRAHHDRPPPSAARCNGAHPAGQPHLRVAGASLAGGREAPPAAPGKLAFPANGARDAGGCGAVAPACHGLPGEVGAAVDVAAWQAAVARLASRAEELRRREERLLRGAS
jgi:hypothetical protein